MAAKWLAAGGLVLTFAGAGLLYVYSVPDATVGNVKIFGPIAIQLDSEEGEESLGPGDWKPLADKVLARHRRWSRIGFACIALGSLLQLAATLS